MADAEALLAEALGVWARVQVVREDPSWEGEPAARSLVERVAAAPRCHDGLLRLLSDARPLVVAHALQALELMGSPALSELPDELCGRRQQVTLHFGSLRYSMDLGGFARRVRKRAQARRAGRST